MKPPPIISKVKGLIPLLKIALPSAQNELLLQTLSENNVVGERDCARHEKKQWPNAKIFNKRLQNLIF